MQEIVKEYKGKQVRIFNLNNAPWFVLIDVCKIIGIKGGSHNVGKTLTSADRKTFKPYATNERYKLVIVNRTGLLHILSRSRKMESRAFFRWVKSNGFLPEDIIEAECLPPTEVKAPCQTNEIVKLFDERPVRIINDGDRQWFVGKDVCKLLGYKNATDAMNRHCYGVVKHYPIVDSLGRQQKVRVLSEGDVMRLICSSKLPNAVRFEKWVFEEVLPSIRKTGAYLSPAMTDNQLEIVLNTLGEEISRRKDAERLASFCQRQLQTIADVASPKRKFCEISKRTGRPMDKVVSAYIRSDKRPHEPEYEKYIQLKLPFLNAKEVLMLISSEYPKLLAQA